MPSVGQQGAEGEGVCEQGGGDGRLGRLGGRGRGRLGLERRGGNLGFLGAVERRKREARGGIEGRWRGGRRTRDASTYRWERRHRRTGS